MIWYTIIGYLIPSIIFLLRFLTYQGIRFAFEPRLTSNYFSMYNNRNSRFSNRSRGPSSGSHSQSGSSRGGRPGGGFNRGGGRPAVRKISTIHPSKYVQRAQSINATPLPDVVKHQSFDEFGFMPMIANNVKRKGYITPTPIQDQAIPAILAGKDVLGIANTGTGKTAAFALPILHFIAQTNKQTKALILAPTRELAIQIDQEIGSFSPGMGIFNALLIGGNPISFQLRALHKKPNIVIATPGRLKDVMQQGYINLQEFSIIVLDEVDRMLDMGFIHDVKFILSHLATERKTMFFSATITPEIQALVSSFLKTHETISVRKQETSKNVEQEMIYVKDKYDKLAKLADYLKQPTFWKSIVFVRTKREADRLQKSLYQMGFKVDAIHGDKPQRKRELAIRLFKSDKIAVLVATDVAARGLDISDVSHVFNYDEPATYEDYIHRIGRTGRANKRGHAITFVVKEGNVHAQREQQNFR